MRLVCAGTVINEGRVYVILLCEGVMLLDAVNGCAWCVHLSQGGERMPLCCAKVRMRRRKCILLFDAVN